MVTLKTSLPNGSRGANYKSTAHRFPKGKRVTLDGVDYIIDRVTWEEEPGVSGILHLMYEDEWEEELSKQRSDRQNLAWLVLGVVLAAVIFFFQN